MWTPLALIVLATLAVLALVHLLDRRRKARLPIRGGTDGRLGPVGFGSGDPEHGGGCGSD